MMEKKCGDDDWLLPSAETFSGPTFPRKGGAWLTLAQLKEIEWIHDSEYDESYCPICNHEEGTEHKEDCWLAKMICEAGGSCLPRVDEEERDDDGVEAFLDWIEGIDGEKSDS